MTTDWQKVRLQEIITDESREDGRMPRTIECELIDDLVDKCIPGDEVQSKGKWNYHNTSFPFCPHLEVTRTCNLACSLSCLEVSGGLLGS